MRTKVADDDRLPVRHAVGWEHPWNHTTSLRLSRIPVRARGPAGLSDSEPEKTVLNMRRIYDPVQLRSFASGSEEKPGWIMLRIPPLRRAPRLFEGAADEGEPAFAPFSSFGWNGDSAFPQ